MSISAIQIAFKLAKLPEEMKRWTESETPLPEEVTDLLRLCSSTERLSSFSESHRLKPITTKKTLINFIEIVLFNTENPPEKILGLGSEYTREQLKLHFQLLIKIFHPDSNNAIGNSDKSALISKTYQELKNKFEEPVQLKNIKLSRVPPKSFYHATKKAEKHHSNLKNAFMALSVMGLLLIGIIFSYLLESSRSELVVSNQQPSTLVAKEILISNTSPFDQIFSVSNTNFENMASILQLMLRDIETYYEKGVVKRIKPILANTPEMQSQTDAQMQMKLENLFRITQDRKMLLYDFKWQNISGKIHGVGKFISRYRMTGENTWLTREGRAVITAEEVNSNFSVTGLTLESNMVK